MQYEQMLTESKHLEAKIAALDSQLKNLPGGRIFSVRNGKYYKWYLSDNHKQIYLPKRKRPLAEKLAYKKYLSYLREDLTHEKEAIDSYLRQTVPFHSRKSSQLLTNKPEYLEIISPFFKPLSQELTGWMNSPYEKNPKHPEQLTHKTASGNIVRSKSEVIIDLALYTNRIPFRYENALQLGPHTLYPDFTIRHPETGALFYWEHFGLMGDPSYCQNAYKKLQLYTSNGIIPSIHLITTYETKEKPLSSELVEKIIAHYFL